jgi:hypothetical protein
MSPVRVAVEWEEGVQEVEDSPPAILTGGNVTGVAALSVPYMPLLLGA